MKKTIIFIRFLSMTHLIQDDCVLEYILSSLKQCGECLTTGFRRKGIERITGRHRLAGFGQLVSAVVSTRMGDHPLSIQRFGTLRSCLWWMEKVTYKSIRVPARRDRVMPYKCFWPAERRQAKKKQKQVGTGRRNARVVVFRPAVAIRFRRKIITYD